MLSCTHSVFRELSIISGILLPLSNVQGSELSTCSFHRQS